jgi:7,8-dihydropterin-6-yl-methyl-4-(beta-D-ribofuranosyl)aminobenzene 5'-phosphate synthase
MKIITLVENTSKTACKAKHGLSLYIETPLHKLLFDVGPDDTFIKNAVACGVDLTEVDTVVISHGHYDHGGGLGAFLEVNSTAQVYIQRGAFAPHYNKTGLLKLPIGINPKLMQHPQVHLLDGDSVIDEELSVFTVSDTSKCRSPMNDVLLDENGKDSFAHEQNLVIHTDPVVLITGCGHTGIVNIMEKATPLHPAVCIGGFHLFNPALRKTAPDALISEIADVLKGYSETVFYTCHCTGEKAFRLLSQKAGNVRYLACGDVLTI